MDIAILFKHFYSVLSKVLPSFPISSTGHLIVAADLLNFDDGVGNVFEIVIQLGAILAVCWEYRARLQQVAGGLLKGDAAAWHFTSNLLVACLPQWSVC